LLAAGLEYTIISDGIVFHLLGLAKLDHEHAISNQIISINNININKLSTDPN
jgi:hypothetical protein